MATLGIVEEIAHDDRKLENEEEAISSVCHLWEEELSVREDVEEVDLEGSLYSWLSNAPSFCEPSYVQRATHISSLPYEIILLILRWVVSRDLDVRSLEMCSLVSRGFYLCSRDPEIWRLICQSIWGLNCASLKSSLSWRELYLTRPHLNYSGCYISKTSYVRQGEPPFGRTREYKQWHVVEYYRYLRFFPEGKVLMMTTSEPPAAMIAHLRYRNPKYPAVIKGRFDLCGEQLTLILQRTDTKTVIKNNNREISEKAHNTYSIGLQLKPWKRKTSWHLEWTNYMVVTKQGATESVTNFEVCCNKFRPFWFSRVRSYAAEAEEPL